MDRDQLAEHLRFAAELGVAGVSRDPAWRRIGDGTQFQTANSSPKLLKTNDASGQIEAEKTPVPFFRDAAEALGGVKSFIGECTRCKLSGLGRTQVVFGTGSPTADLMFVGEAPGADEDEQGMPFVGKSGQLLTKIIEAIDLKREDVYIANVIKCRPPQNRNPEPDEIATCEPFLFQQIDLIQPKVIVTLGKFAAQCLLRSEEPISRLRGRLFDYRGAKLIPTFHPAYLLRNPSSKREVWEDMKVVKKLLSQK
jgi:DNA polymerase